MAVGLLALLAACGSAQQPASPPNDESNQVANVSAPPATQLSEADQSRVCRTAIADMNGHPPSIVRVVSSHDGVVRVRYTRPSDRRIWTNECRIEGSRVVWRTVDAFGSGSGFGRWRTDPRDEVFTYSIAGSRISITTTFPGGSPSTETYTVR
jgi:hypothetical protein